MKLKLKQDQDLKIYSANVFGRKGRSSAFAVGYSAEDAADVIAKNSSGPSKVQITGFTLLQPILEGVEFDIPEKKQKTTEEQFILNLKLAVDEFIKDEKDKKAVKKILDKHEKKYKATKS